MFMANLSSVNPVTDEAGPSYDSDFLSEYVKDNAVPVVHSNVSSVPNDAYMMIYNHMYEPHAQSVSNTSRNTVVENSLTTELATYKEQVELYERRDKFELTEREQKINEQLRLIIYDRNFKEKTLKKALTKEIKEIKDVFKELEAEVAQNIVDRKNDAIEQKNLLIANDNLNAECLSKEVFSVAINSELNVARFTEMHVANTIVEARFLELEAELSNLRVNRCTNASRSRPRSNTKNTKISPAKDVNKMQVEEQPMTNKSILRTSNRVDSSSRLKRTEPNHDWGSNFPNSPSLSGFKCRVYYVEGLGYNLFSVGQICDSDLEVAFRKHSCYVRDTNGVELIKGSRGSNLYTISVEDIMKSSSICLLSKASKNKSWLAFKPLELCLGLVPNSVPTTLYVSPTNKDLKILFQPMFDEYLEPPRVERSVSPAQAVQAPVNSAGTPSSTTIDQDAPFLSISPSSSALQSYQGVAAKSTFMEDNHVAPVNNNPFINVFASEPSSDVSSS
nr:integrase, catalytic region, zinc finger, CCHC-type, peptidase aspartic, catalytic [Tanacetum cinerariifolium]